MPTILYTLEQQPEDHAMLYETCCGAFLNGECYAFALALHQGLGWPIVGLIKPWDEASQQNDVIWHAGVRSPDGRIHDARGLLTEEAFGGYFLSPPFIIREVTADELYATRGTIEDRAIHLARRFAEVLWPDLPWTQTQAMRVRAFADALEALSQEHGLWICGGVPADPPRLFIAGGEEGGYLVRPTMDGLAHTITRYYPFDVAYQGDD